MTITIPRRFILGFCVLGAAHALAGLALDLDDVWRHVALVMSLTLAFFSGQIIGDNWPRMGGPR